MTFGGRIPFGMRYGNVVEIVAPRWWKSNDNTRAQSKGGIISGSRVLRDSKREALSMK